MVSLGFMRALVVLYKSRFSVGSWPFFPLEVFFDF